MSSPIYELLKRPDELFVVEHAHLSPRFVEDSVRLMIRHVLDAYGDELADDDFVHARQVNFETIHDHDVLAERFGTVGELRRSSRPACASRRHTELRTGCRPPAANAPAAQAERRPALLAAGEPAHVAAVEHRDRDGGPIVKPSTGQDASKTRAKSGRDTPAAIEATDA